MLSAALHRCYQRGRSDAASALFDTGDYGHSVRWLLCQQDDPRSDLAEILTALPDQERDGQTYVIEWLVDVEAFPPIHDRGGRGFYWQAYNAWHRGLCEALDMREVTSC